MASTPAKRPKPTSVREAAKKKAGRKQAAAKRVADASKSARVATPVRSPKSATGAKAAKGGTAANGGNPKTGRKTAASEKSLRPGKPARAAKLTGTPLDRIRAFCLSLPETAEVEAWGAPTFRVKGKIFVMYIAGGNHHGERPAAWILSVSMEQDLMLRVRPERYFKPPYVGPSGWIGAYLDKSPPWSEIEELLRDGWRRRAPKKLAALLEG